MYVALHGAADPVFRGDAEHAGAHQQTDVAVTGCQEARRAVSAASWLVVSADHPGNAG